MIFFSRRLKELRTEKKLTLEDLANILGTTKTTLSRYENSKRIPDSEFIKSAADFFDVSSDYLLGRSDNRKVNYNYSNDTSYKIDISDLSDENKKKVEEYVELLKYKYNEHKNDK